MNTNTYAIKILDTKGMVIGEMMTATTEDIMKFLNKGFTVIDIHTEALITQDTISSRIGTSDGLITI